MLFECCDRKPKVYGNCELGYKIYCDECRRHVVADDYDSAEYQWNVAVDPHRVELEEQAEMSHLNKGATPVQAPAALLHQELLDALKQGRATLGQLRDLLDAYANDEVTAEQVAEALYSS